MKSKQILFNFFIRIDKDIFSNENIDDTLKRKENPSRNNITINVRENNSQRNSQNNINLDSSKKNENKDSNSKKTIKGKDGKIKVIKDPKEEDLLDSIEIKENKIVEDDDEKVEEVIKSDEKEKEEIVNTESNLTNPSNENPTNLQIRRENNFMTFNNNNTATRGGSLFPGSRTRVNRSGIHDPSSERRNNTSSSIIEKVVSNQVIVKLILILLIIRFPVLIHPRL